MRLDKRSVRLIAVGASIAANCQPCLETNVSKALEYGADQQDINEAIEVGKMVRKGAASKMDQFSSGLSDASPSPDSTKDAECGCDGRAMKIVGGKHG
jgi:AhpD family alkylhydroperoxidase